jgi:hypothetical protein
VLAQEEVAVVEGCGCDFYDDFVFFGGSVWDGDVFEGVVDFAGFAVYFADGDSFDHVDGLM